MDPCSDGVAAQKLSDGSAERWIRAWLRQTSRECLFGDVPPTVNNRLRTGADKGNPTV